MEDNRRIDWFYKAAMRSLADSQKLASHAYSTRYRTPLLCVVAVVITSAAFWAIQRFSVIERQKSLRGYSSSVKSGIPTVSLCELLANPRSYDVKVVRVEAIFIANHGDRSLYDQSCITMEPMVGVELDAALQFEPGGNVDKAFYDLIEQASENKTASARMTMVGRFEGPNFLKDGRQSRFQHQLVLMKLEKAEPLMSKETPFPHQ